MLDLSKLNKEQKTAVTCPLQPTLIVAGAGTGKTTVLTNRIAYLIDEVGIHHNRICAITFTNKAAKEMRDRVGKLLNDIKANWITTYHSLCFKILREDLIHPKRTHNFAIIDDEEQRLLITDILKKNKFSTSLIKPNKIIKLISYFKNNNLNINDDYDINDLRIFNLRSYDEWKIFKTCYKSYENFLDLNNHLDYDDLINLTHSLLKLNIDIRKKWQNNFDAILVDEFQDTNKKQFEILNFIVNPDHNNVFVVGDPDQTIYTWRGAYSDIFDEFFSIYKNVNMIVLNMNYRSTQNIINCSNKLISNNKNRIEKSLKSNNGKGEEVSWYKAESQSDEAHFIAKQIKKMLNSKKWQPSQIAILYRSNFLSRYIEQALISNQIPYVIFGGLKFYQRKEVKDIIAYLKVINNEDELSFKRIVNVPSRKIGEATIEKIQSYANDQKISFIEASKLKDSHLPKITWNTSSLINFWKMIEEFRLQLSNTNLSSVVQSIIEKINYYDYLKSLDFESRIDNTNELINGIKQFEEEHKSLNGIEMLKEYLLEIQLYTDTNISSNQKKTDFVSLMTVHVAKGTEFDVVFVFSLNDGIMPIIKVDSLTNMEEERRIAYVALTRAKNKLFLTSTFGGNSYETYQTLFPSRFIKEIGEENLFEELPIYESISSKDLNWYDSKEKEDFSVKNYEQKNIDFAVGDVVVHTIFQSGIVISVNKDTIDVLFKAPHGKKTIIKNHKSIKRMKN